MSIKTRYYGLEAFTEGDVYSAVVDQKRFIAIDNLLAFISDRIGEGVIEGWEVSINGEKEDLTLRVSPGIGIIERTVMQTFGYIDFNLINGVRKYIYLKKKSDEIGGFSGYSNIIALNSPIDNISPSQPEGLVVEDSLTSYDKIGFSWDIWDMVVDPDFDHYEVRRIDNEEYYGYIVLISNTTELLYIDTDLKQDTLYTYQVVAVDKSGNVSIPAETSIRTEIDTRVPAAPLFVQVFIGSESLQILWDHSPSDYVEYYEVKTQLLDNSYEVVEGEEIVSLISENSMEEFGSTYNFVEGLINGENYRVSVRSLSYGGQYSEDIFKIIQPRAVEGTGEVRNISASFEQSELTNILMEADIFWSYKVDEYPSLPDQFFITFIENGVKISDVIEVREENVKISTQEDIMYYSYHIKLIAFDSKYESIKEYMPYVIVIQTYIEDTEITSNGAFYRVNRTPLYQVLPSVENVNITRISANNNILVQWDNPTPSFLDYVRISVNMIDLGTGIETSYVDGQNIGKVEEFIIDGRYFDTITRYDVTIIPVDIFDRDGLSYQMGKQFLEDEIDPRPLSPSQISAIGEDGCVTLRWEVDATREISQYKIYRASGKIFYLPEDFNVVAIVPINYFIDYDVINGVEYVYFVTSVNIYGNESLNPIDDQIIPTVFKRATPVQSTILAPISNLQGSVNNRDVELVWESSSGAFDGYEIYRSQDNKYTFELIDRVFASQVSYIDENALLKNNQINYYIVRKYRNEMNVFVTESTVSPSNSILLAVVITYQEVGEQQIEIISLAKIIKNLETLLAQTVEEKISAHKHILTEGTDHRIELEADTVISNWTTTDFQTYETISDIEGGATYIVRIYGTVNEDYFINENGDKDLAAIQQARSGFAPILYELDVEQKRITFSVSLYTLCEEPSNVNPLASAEKICPSVPYVTVPLISVEVVGASEVNSLLQNERIESIDASQITTGILSDKQLPEIKHEGRIGESLLPVRLLMKSIDNFVYSLVDTYTDDDRNRMGTSVTFYDIISVGEEGLLAATSSGIWFSPDWGSEWQKKQSFSIPIYKLYKSSANQIFAITNYTVYLNDGDSYGSWKKMIGLEGVKVIRNIVEDNVGNIFITTDLGVFRLNKDKPFIEDMWEQLSIFGPRSSEAYGIIYIEEENKILVGNEMGVLGSFNTGNTWTYIDEFPSLTKVNSFIREGDYLFALTNDSVYRRKIGESQFFKISDLATDMSRHIVLFNDKIYATTNEGAKVSNTSNVYENVDVDFISTWTFLNEKRDTSVVVFLKKVDVFLFLGIDRRLYIFNQENKLWLQYEQFNTTVPSVYVNGELQEFGYYYNNEGAFQNIAFDEIVKYGDIIEVANKYDIYVSKYGGWVQNKIDAEVEIWKNERLFGKTTTNIDIDVSKFKSFTFPVFDDTNSNYITALSYKMLLEDDLKTLTGLTVPTGNELVKLVAETYHRYTLFFSQLYGTDKVNNFNSLFPSLPIKIINQEIGYTPIGEITYQEIDTGATVDPVNGEIFFPVLQDKFDDMKINIYGCTVDNAGELSHRELEDGLEMINSGFPSSLSQVQQINIVKLGLFNEKLWPGQQTILSTSFQANYIIPSEEQWFDVLNSTINYEEEIINEDISFSILYPTAVLYVSNNNSIIVGGNGGIIKIQLETLEIEEDENLNIVGETVRQIVENSSVIYIVTDKNLYRSEDYGDSWEQMGRGGLSNELCSIGFVNNNIIIGTVDGIYYRTLDNTDWIKVLQSTNSVEIIINPDLLFVVVDNKIYMTGDGYSYSELNVEMTGQITQMIKIGTVIYVSTDKGLYSDAGSFYGELPHLTRFIIDNEIENNNSSNVLFINDLYTDFDKVAIATSNGNYYIIETEGVKKREYSYLESIHKILLINGQVYLFGYNQMKVELVNYPIRLTTGVLL